MEREAEAQEAWTYLLQTWMDDGHHQWCGRRILQIRFINQAPDFGQYRWKLVFCNTCDLQRWAKEQSLFDLSIGHSGFPNREEKVSALKPSYSGWSTTFQFFSSRLQNHGILHNFARWKPGGLLLRQSETDFEDQNTNSVQEDRDVGQNTQHQVVPVREIFGHFVGQQDGRGLHHQPLDLWAGHWKSDLQLQISTSSSSDAGEGLQRNRVLQSKCERNHFHWFQPDFPLQLCLWRIPSLFWFFVQFELSTGVRCVQSRPANSHDCVILRRGVGELGYETRNWYW